MLAASKASRMAWPGCTKTSVVESLDPRHCGPSVSYPFESACIDRAGKIRKVLSEEDMEGSNKRVAEVEVAKPKKGSTRKLGGLSLPDVVRELLKERNVVRWDPVEGLYEVLDGDLFESRYG